MNVWQIRAASSDDLSAINRLLPAAEVEAAAFVDGNPSDQLLLAVPVDRQDTAPVGCIRVRRQIGLEQPRYWYHVGCVVHAAADLGLYHRERTLLLGNDHTGATELADVAIDRQRLDASQQGMVQRLLVRSALLLLQRDRQFLPATTADSARVIAALPGVRDSHGDAPFWEGLGRHFYPGDVHQAMARFGSAWLTHVAALLPRHPLVVSLLHADAQAAIGAIDADARSLRDAFTEAGLRAGQHLTLYDAGPVYEAHFDLLAAVNPLRQRRVQVREQLQAPRLTLFASAAGTNAGLIEGQESGDDMLAVSAASAQLFGLKDGDAVVMATW